CGVAPSDRPSTVAMRAGDWHSIGSARHDRIGSPSSRTAHAPHSPSSQPCFVPHRFRSSRSTSRSVLYGAKAISVASRLTVSVMCAFGIFRLATRGFRGVGGALRAAQSRNREGGDLFGDGGRTLRTVGTEPVGGPVERAEERARRDRRVGVLEL